MCARTESVLGFCVYSIKNQRFPMLINRRHRIASKKKNRRYSPAVEFSREGVWNLQWNYRLRIKSFAFFAHILLPVSVLPSSFCIVFFLLSASYNSNTHTHAVRFIHSRHTEMNRSKGEWTKKLWTNIFVARSVVVVVVVVVDDDVVIAELMLCSLAIVFQCL